MKEVKEELTGVSAAPLGAKSASKTLKDEFVGIVCTRCASKHLECE